MLIFPGIFLHPQSHLVDWFDYPYYVWTLSSVADSLSSMNSSGFFNAKIFYPFESVLLFSDLLIPQTIIWKLSSLFSQSAITNFNVSFIATIYLNAVAAFIFWKTITKNKLQQAVATIITTFSPYFFTQFHHFQMISFWPLLLAMSYLPISKSSNTLIKRSVWIGFWLAVQFLASVYLAFFGITMVLIFCSSTILVDFITDKKFVWQRYKIGTLSFVVGSVVWLLIAGPFLYKYVQAQHSYNITRQYSEYVLYSAHITDYLFSSTYQSLESHLLGRLNALNDHTVGELAVFPTFTLVILTTIALIKIVKNKEYNKTNVFFSLLLISGFIFSLGPRLNVNGEFLGLRLPYLLVLKLYPLAEPIRAVARWSFLLYFASIYFSIKAIGQLKLSSLVILSILIIYILEVLPINPQTSSYMYITPSNEVLSQQCQPETKVLLEYPITQTAEGVNVATNLRYRSTAMLASLESNCTLVNGYSGYDPQDYLRFEGELNQAVKDLDKQAFDDLLEQRNIELLRINKSQMATEQLIATEELLAQEPIKYATVYSNEKESVYQRLY